MARAGWWGVLMILLAALPAAAQRVTGTIDGKVVDDTGAVLPGATVTISSPALLGGERSAVTDASGGFRFPALKPGDYILRVELDGFKTVIKSGIPVEVGATNTQQIELQLAQVQETITVSAEATPIDTQKSGYSTNFTNELVENLPVARNTFFDLVMSAPGIQSNDQNNATYSSVFGSGEESNSYQMDGTEVRAVQIGSGWPFPNYDIIEEVEFFGIGAPAEFGNFQGGVINVVTKTGSNSFNADFGFYYQNSDLTANNSSAEQFPPNPLLSPAPEIRSGEVDFLPIRRNRYKNGSVNLGFPFLQDRLWGFWSYEAREDSFTNINVPRDEEERETSQRIFFKINGQISDDVSFEFGVHNDYYELPSGSNSGTNPVATTERFVGDNPTINAIYTHVLSDNTFFEIKYGGLFAFESGDPGSGRNSPAHFDSLTGYYFVDSEYGGELGSFEGLGVYVYRNRWDRAQINGAVSHFADDFLGGDHEFKFGVQTRIAGIDVVNAYTGGAFYYDYGYYNYADYDEYGYGVGDPVGFTPYPYGAYFQDAFHYGGDIRQLAFFIDDSWKVHDRVTLNLGLRFDHLTGSIPDFPEITLFNPDGSLVDASLHSSDNEGYEGWFRDTGRTIAGRGEVVSFNNVTPRVGLTVRLDEQGKGVFRATWGRYYEDLLSSFFDQATDSIARFERRILDFEEGPDLNGDGLITRDDFVILNGFLDYANQYNIDPELKNQYTDQWSVGVERQLPGGIAVGATGVFKKGHDIIGQQNQLFFVPGNFELIPARDVALNPDSVPPDLMVYNQIDPSPEDGLPFDENRFLITNPDRFRHEYKSLVLHANKRFADNWQMVASLQFEDAQGTGPQGTAFSGSGGGLIFRGGFNRDPNDGINNDGPLPDEKPVVFKLQGSYLFPGGWTLAANWINASGRTYERRVIVVLDQGFKAVSSEPRGSRRFPRINNLDLRVQKTFEFGERFYLSAFFDLFNSFNNGAITDVNRINNTDPVDDPQFVPQRIVLPRRLQLGFKLGF
ncbi:MAG TPA: TonB-dependent receptor [Acidobacteriota bacterium]